MMTRVSSEVAALLAEPRKRRIAVVGATRDPKKYGNIILRFLMRAGFDVVPINPSEEAIEGLPAFASVADAGGAFDIVDFVVPPEVSLEVVAGIDPARVGVLWFQPGSFDAEVVRAAEGMGTVVAGPCIMVETPR